MKKQEIKLYSQDMTCALLEPLNHCSDNDEDMVFLCVFKTILHFSEMYDWIVTIDSKIIPGSSFDLAALNAVIQKNIKVNTKITKKGNIIFTNLGNEILMLYC